MEQGRSLSQLEWRRASLYEKQEDAPEDASAATPVQHSMPPSAAASASGDADLAATISAAQISAAQIDFDEEVHEFPDATDVPGASDANDVSDASALPAYEKQEDAPEDAPAATPVQHSMPPSAAASASGDADPAATISAAQISAAQIGTQCPTKTRNSRPNSSRSPDCFSELKKMKTCNYSSKRQCGLLSLLDEYT
nr:hypothetical protein CFP56_43154 [Quercus suber]